MTEPRSLFIDLGRSRRHVIAWGDPGAPALVLQHGMRDHARSWDWIARHFSDRYHVVAPDLRGHGDSDWSPDGAYNLADYVIDMADVADALGLSAFDLLGHSLGGHISVRFAATFPEKITRLAIIEGIELPIIRDQRQQARSHPSRLRGWIEDRRRQRAGSHRYYATLAEATTRMAEQNPDMDAATIAHIARHGVISEAGRGFRWKYDNACRFRPPEDAHGLCLDEILDAITCPTLVAYGDKSWIAQPPAERLRRIRNHHLVTFPGASHWLHHQAREAFLTAMERFLADS